MQYEVHFAHAKEGKYMHIIFFLFFLNIFQCWNISFYGFMFFLVFKLSVREIVPKDT